jgi:hypothetical protein
MDSSKNISSILIFFVGLVLLVWLTNVAMADTNISSVQNQHWGWSDVIGWIDFYSTNSVLVTSGPAHGYASSSIGDISLDCATSRNGNICGQSNYDVTNDGSGNLSGWGWNDQYGWISFCGGQGTGSCPGSITYQAQVDMSTGVFKGNSTDYAWNDVVGWIAFNCASYSGCGTSNYELVVGGTTSTVALLDSTPYDTGVSGGAQLNSILWQGSLPAGTNVYFQFASSNSANGPWNFVGPDGTANTFYGPTTPGTSYKVDYTLHNNKRYFEYRVTLYSDAYLFNAPRVDEINVNWSP